MTGVGSLIVGSGVTFGWWQANTVGQPKWWWIGSVCAFSIATFLAWNDEHTARLQAEAERGGPQLILEFVQAPILYVTAGPPWRLTNSGKGDALEVRGDPWRQGSMFATITTIQRIAQGDSSTLSFRTFTDAMEASGGVGILSAHPEQVLEQQLRPLAGNEGEAWPSADEIMKRGEARIPVRFRYKDATGQEFETTCTIAWNSFNHTGQVEETKAKKVMAAPWPQRLRGCVNQFLVRHRWRHE